MSLLHASVSRALCVSLVLALALTGCSSSSPDASGEDEERARTGTGASDPDDPAAGGLQVRTTVSRVNGSLTEGQRAGLEREAGKLLAGYLAAAYLHERPAAGYRGSFPGFTRGARELALRDVDTTSDAAFADADEVRPRGAVAFLSVVAPQGRPVGATARVFLNLAVFEGDRDRWVEVRGRLLMTPAADTWRIFGYDLSVDASPRGGRVR